MIDATEGAKSTEEIMDAVPNQAALRKYMKFNKQIFL